MDNEVIEECNFCQKFDIFRTKKYNVLHQVALTKNFQTIKNRMTQRWHALKSHQAIGYFMRNSCVKIKGGIESQKVLELHRGCQSGGICTTSDLEKKSEDNESEDWVKDTSYLNLRYIQNLLRDNRNYRDKETKKWIVNNKWNLNNKKHRTSFCCNRQFNINSSTKLLDNGTTTNIYHCQHHSCSVCSKKIFSDKSRQIRKVFKYVKRKHHEASFYMMTLTISHSKKDSLEDRVRKISEMKRKLLAHKVIKDLDSLLYHSTLEIVYGKSGWHAHYHICLSKKGEIQESQIESIRNQWHKIGKKIGINVNLEKGFHIGSTDCVDALASYVSKSQELKDMGKKLASELVSDNKTYDKKETYSIQQLIGLAAAGLWNKISYSRVKVEQLILEYLMLKNINYFRGSRSWNSFVKESKNENIDSDSKEKDVKKYIEISSKAYNELLSHDLLLGNMKYDRDKDGKIKKDEEGQKVVKEFEGILKVHRGYEDIEDTWAYIDWVLEKKEKDLYLGIRDDIKKVIVSDEEKLDKKILFSGREQVYMKFSQDTFCVERKIAA